MPRKPLPSTPPPQRQRLRADEPRLTREDWLDAAYAAVVDGGFDGLRVLPLAHRLRVTRGSFYWHFASQAELQDALLARWRQQQIAIDDVLQAQSTAYPQLDLAQVLDTALAQIGARQEHMRFELALRGLGRRNESVAALLAEVDALRMQRFEEKFLRLTGDAHKAGELAALFYLALVGCYQALGRPGNPPQLQEHLKRLLCVYLVEQQAATPPAARSAGRAKGRRA